MFDAAGNPPPFWHNGPTPGGLYNFPGPKTAPSDFRQHSQAPVTTATSIVAMQYNKGVIIAGDLLGSYGSLARYRNCPRIMKVNDNIILGAGGDYADFQYVKDIIEQKIIDEDCLDDGFKLKPKSLYCWLTRIMYNRRSKFDPFWNNFVVGGLQDGEPFLGTVDKLGTAYTDKIVCSGYGAYIAVPLLREALEKNPTPSKAEARALVEKCMEVLYYRDARSYPKYQIATIDEADGAVVEDLVSVNQNWSLAHMIY
ncbi:proteasome subunit beta type-4 [Tribolium castaneum]|uniref:Proteasome subunit beta n=1 Tax=Tribolium castaneum TaxID=7070 RepID=D6WTK4_TRICA|nr:PREDICTED: proteasome subunit beta type-4 [Tribolium castaneum]EFA05833.1 Proteasome subunit beta type-4-like Protein [Tribolium castaneum]|eukprot:XP_974991.1 PREDICTED: proteasome subunit beta type-4 [Tribolium castaneum]